MATELRIATRKVVSVNPATGEILREFDSAADSSVHAAVARARSAQARWNELGARRRVAVLREFQRLLHARKSDVAALITREAGKPHVEALLTEVLVVLDAARFCMENAFDFLREQPVPHGNLAMKTKTGRILREPQGVIGIISPWNYPFSIPATESLSALVTGNAVVLKPSELTSLNALELASLLHEAGVPKDVFQVVVGDGAAGSALLNSEIDKLVFTGSLVTGKGIAQAAAARLLPVVLELGGKDPMLVLDDADVDVASSGAVWGSFANCGQACLSVERC
jgi:succinate-semialdehyde dehydrogenase/glutarate-semialdehyde dehydrogenase